MQTREMMNKKSIRGVVDLKQSIQKDIESKKANQHLSQDNTCYRGNSCQQANEAEQVVGKDNEAAGFNDQSDNLSTVTSSNTTNSTS